ncbi:MAG: hypothetical protein V7750_16765 [Sneathiella sp.]
MSIQLNQFFLDNPKKFFKNHFVTLPDYFCFNTGLGIRRIDLNVSQNERAVKERRFRGPVEIPVIAVSRYEPEIVPIEPEEFSTISIYWLPSKEHAVTNIQLGDEADFFLTTTLNGCRIEIENSDIPEILHIAGGYSNERQLEVADEYFGERPHRGISYAPNQGYANADNAIFYGIRDRRTNQWQFYIQGYDHILFESQRIIRAGIHGKINYSRIYKNRGV